MKKKWTPHRILNPLRAGLIFSEYGYVLVSYSNTLHWNGARGWNTPQEKQELWILHIWYDKLRSLCISGRGIDIFCRYERQKVSNWLSYSNHTLSWSRTMFYDTSSPVKMLGYISILWPWPSRNIDTKLILGLRPANERRRYKVTPSLIGWAQS